MESEEWRLVPGFGGYYEASSFGRVRSLDRMVSGARGSLVQKRGRVLTPCVGKFGYLYHCIRWDGNKKGVKIHRLVALAFGIILGAEHVNHIDGDKKNNRPENLEATTPYANVRHAIRTGLRDRCWGEKHYKATLSESEAKEALTLAAHGWPKTAIAEAYGVSDTAILYLLLGKSWKHLEPFRQEVLRG